MARIVWIASYPKSGNTWVRFLVANLLYKPIEQSAEVERLVPDIHWHIEARHLLGEQTRFIKTHWRYHDRLPLREDTAGVIYIVRNPLDVLVSNLNYFLLRRGDSYFAASPPQQRELRTRYVEEYIERGGAREWIDLGMGTWPENVTTWLSEDVPYPRVFVRYEDLKEDPSEFLVRLCDFVGREKTNEEVSAAVARSSFDALRAMEEREVGANTFGLFRRENPAPSYAHGARFMHEGRAALYRETLTPAQVAAARRRFKPLIERLGYRL